MSRIRIILGIIAILVAAVGAVLTQQDSANSARSESNSIAMTDRAFA